MKILYVNIAKYDNYVQNNIYVLLWYILFTHTYDISSYNDMRQLALIFRDFHISKLKVT